MVFQFQYGAVIDYCLARCSMFQGRKEYAITIMNGELEKLLFGQHIIFEKEGCLQAEITGNEVQNRLKESVATALAGLLGMPLRLIQAAPN
jgi:uncharacterized protein YqgQ